MADVPLRFRWVRRLGAASVAVGVVTGLAMLVVGCVLLVMSRQDGRWLTAGMALLFGGIVVDIVSLIAYGLLILGLKVEATTYRLHSTLLDLDDRINTLLRPVREIAENTQISDAAKSIAHRAAEREALRKAIREEILHQDWEAAYYLIDEMERRFGYRQEAQRIRREVDTSRQETIERMIVEAIAHIEELCDQRNWAQARIESDRLLRLFPRHEKVRDVGEIVDRKRDEYKATLLRAYEEALGRNESDRCVALLKELDAYLTPSEAEALADSARGVFRTRLLNLGVQFSISVTERRWRDALEIGLQITGEFPNSRMAQEVRSRLDVLQKRAGLSPDAIAEVIQQRPSAAAK